MLMLRTTRFFSDGLCKTCFKIIVFAFKCWGGTGTLSFGWLKVKEQSSFPTGKSSVVTPFTL